MNGSTFLKKQYFVLSQKHFITHEITNTISRPSSTDRTLTSVTTDDAKNIHVCLFEYIITIDNTVSIGMTNATLQVEIRIVKIFKLRLKQIINYCIYKQKQFSIGSSLK